MSDKMSGRLEEVSIGSCLLLNTLDKMAQLFAELARAIRTHYEQLSPAMLSLSSVNNQLDSLESILAEDTERVIASYTRRLFQRSFEIDNECLFAPPPLTCSDEHVADNCGNMWQLLNEHLAICKTTMLNSVLFDRVLDSTFSLYVECVESELRRTMLAVGSSRTRRRLAAPSSSSSVANFVRRHLRHLAKSDTTQQHQTSAILLSAAEQQRARHAVQRMLDFLSADNDDDESTTTQQNQQRLVHGSLKLRRLLATLDMCAWTRDQLIADFVRSQNMRQNASTSNAIVRLKVELTRRRPSERSSRAERATQVCGNQMESRTVTPPPPARCQSVALRRRWGDKSTAVSKQVQKDIASVEVEFKFKAASANEWMNGDAAASYELQLDVAARSPASSACGSCVLNMSKLTRVAAAQDVEIRRRPSGGQSKRSSRRRSWRRQGNSSSGGAAAEETMSTVVANRLDIWLPLSERLAVDDRGVTLLACLSGHVNDKRAAQFVGAKRR